MNNNKALLLSIKPQYVSLIKSGTKKFELRRKSPRVVKGDLVLVYESSPTKSLVGAFTVGQLLNDSPTRIWKAIGSESGITKTEFFKYFEGSPTACAIGINEFWSLDDPVFITQIREKIQIEPPQSFRYLCGRQAGKLLNK